MKEQRGWLQDKTEQVVLGSGSPRRRELLQVLGVPFVVDKSTKEEVTRSSVPEDVVMELAEQKAAEVAQRHPDGSLVIGADTIVALEGRILGKPADAADAAKMLHALQGKTHQVYTGVCLIRQKGDTCEKEVFYECTKVHVAQMTDGEIAEYVATGEPLDKAGAYGIQGYFAPFVTGIEGDYYNVVGLPVHALYAHLFGRT